MAQTLHNNVFTKLAASLSNSATSISLLDGSDFPTPAVGDFYFATLVSISGSTGKEDDWEIVKVTGKPATNTLTVTRGQEGTAARAWDTYTPCEIRITAGTVVMPDGTQNLSNKTITASTLDSTVVGGTTAAAGSFTDLDATTVDATNVEVTNLKAKDGTAAGSIADSTGVVSLNSAVLTTADINGGTVDGATIGQTTPALGTFTDMVADELQLTGGTGDQGTFTWNSDEDTVALVISSGESLQLGQEVEYNVRNNSGSSIAKGVPVMITGTIGSSGRITIDEMDATSVANDKKYLGITAEAIGSGADGKVMFFGKVSGLDTSSYSAGDLLFLDTSVVGGLTATEPNSGIKLGAAYVVHSHASAGVLMVRPSASVGLHDLHDVFVDAPGTGEIIRYNATSGLWETKTLAEADIATVTYVDSQITSNNELSEILATGNATGGTDIAVGTGDDITFADSSKAIFGAGSDLEIYHDGTNSWVKETNASGSFFVDAANLYLRTDDGQAYLAAVKDSYVRLYHDDSVKLETTSIGIDVTGDVNSDSVTTGTFTSTGIDDNATSNAITIDTNENVGIGGIASPQAPLHIYKTETSVGETDPIARFERFTSGDNAYLDITVDNDNNLIGFQSTGTSDGGFTFGGAATERMRLTSAGKLGILTDNPARELDIKLAQDTLTTLGQKGGINLYAPSNTVGNGGEITWSSAINGEVWAAISGHIISNGSGTAGGDLVFATANNAALPTERMRLDRTGNFGIGVTDPTATLDVDGTIKLDGDYPLGSANVALGNLALDAITSGSSNTAIGRSALTELTSGAANTAVGSVALDAATTGNSNSAFGYASLSELTTGSFNSAIGRETLFYNTTGVHNAGSGYAALYSNTTGNYNTAFGSQALVSNTTTTGSTGVGYRAGYTANGAIVTAIGFQALFSNTTGGTNTAVGYNAMLSNTTGNSNTAVGNIALDANTTGSDNVAMGYSALGQNTTGGQNVAIGRSCLTQNTTGTVTTAVGYTAMYSNTTGHSNTAMGFEALHLNTTGTHNTAFGRESLEDNTTGYYNTALGTFSLYDNTTGQSNVGVGYGAVQSNTIANYNTGVGYQALLTNTTSSNNVAVGSFAAKSNTGGSNTAIGYATLWASGAGSNNIAVGLNALFSNTSANWNTAVGTSSAVDNTTGNYLTAVGGYALENNTTGARNTGVGYASLRSNTTGGYNTGLGYAALNANAAGFYNTAVGYNAALSLTNDNYNVAIGYEALRDLTVVGSSGNVAVGAFSQQQATSYYNVSVGYQSLQDATDFGNVAVGHNAGANIAHGSQNLALGYRAMISATTSDYNVAVGPNALEDVTTGSHNVGVGFNAGQTQTTASGNVHIGSYAGRQSTASYCVAIGYASMYSTTTAVNLVAVGNGTLYNTTTGSNNTAVGYSAVQYNTTGYSNTAVGYAALTSNTTGANNCAFGYSAGDNQTTAQYNTHIGYAAGDYVTTGGNNTNVGSFAGQQNVTGISNTNLGYNAGGATTSSYNVMLGMNAGDTNTGGAGNIVIGYGADVHTASANYAIALGYGCISVGSQYFTFGTGSGNDRVYNQFSANASWTRVSDQRYKKEIIENADCGLSFINDLRPVTFKWKAKSEIDADLPDYDPEKTEADYASKMYGLIAQEVKEAMDKHGITDFAGWHEQEDSGIQGISQEMFIHPLIKAVQELSAKVDALEAQLSGE